MVASSKLNQLDELIKKVKEKTDTIGITVADMFIILTLEILRGELVGQKAISNETLSACLEIKASTSHFYYYRDYPELYSFIQAFFNGLNDIDKRFDSADMNTIGFELKDWQNYVSSASINLLNSLPTQYYYKE